MSLSYIHLCLPFTLLLSLPPVASFPSSFIPPLFHLFLFSSFSVFVAFPFYSVSDSPSFSFAGWWHANVSLSRLEHSLSLSLSLSLLLSLFTWLYVVLCTYNKNNVSLSLSLFSFWLSDSLTFWRTLSIINSLCIYVYIYIERELWCCYLGQVWPFQRFLLGPSFIFLILFVTMRYKHWGFNTIFEQKSSVKQKFRGSFLGQFGHL